MTLAKDVKVGGFVLLRKRPERIIAVQHVLDDRYVVITIVSDDGLPFSTTIQAESRVVCYRPPAPTEVKIPLCGTPLSVGGVTLHKAGATRVMVVADQTNGYEVSFTVSVSDMVDALRKLGMV